MTIEVMGRNGFEYDATHITGKLHIVGHHVVEVENGKCGKTICRATKANLKRIWNYESPPAVAAQAMPDQRPYSGYTLDQVKADMAGGDYSHWELSAEEQAVEWE